MRETHKPDSRLHYRKFIKLGPAKKVEVLAEEGRIEVDRFDLWKRTWPKDWEPCATANSG